MMAKMGRKRRVFCFPQVSCVMSALGRHTKGSEISPGLRIYGGCFGLKNPKPKLLAIFNLGFLGIWNPRLPSQGFQIPGISDLAQNVKPHHKATSTI